MSLTTKSLFHLGCMMTLEVSTVRRPASKLLLFCAPNRMANVLALFFIFINSNKNNIEIPLDAVCGCEDESGGDEGAAAVALVVDQNAHLPGEQTAVGAFAIHDSRSLVQRQTADFRPT